MQVIIKFIIRFLYKITIKTLELFIKQNKKWVVVSGKIDGAFENNSMYFYKFLIENNDFQPWWITRNRTVYKQLLKSYPQNVAYTYSIRGVFIFVKSRFAICSYSAKNFNPLFISQKKICINLWHGTPIKRIGFLDPTMQGFKLKKLKEDLNITNYILASSDFESGLFMDCFKKEQRSILVYGTPRNDFLFDKQTNYSIPNKEQLENHKIILYAPTFRANSKTELLPFENIDLDVLNEFLEKNNSYLLIRKHHNELLRFSDLYSSKVIRDRIHFAGQDQYPDVQVLLKYTDILITDYSGIYFDFLLLNRPIIYVPYDYNEYINERDFLFNYDENTPGPKLYSQNDIIEYLEKCFINPLTDNDIRNQAIEKFHKFTDGKASERILTKMKELNK